MIDIMYAFILLILGLVVVLINYRYTIIILLSLIFFHISLSCNGKNVPPIIFFLVGVIYAIVVKELWFKNFSVISKFIWANGMFFLFALSCFMANKLLTNSSTFQNLKFEISFLVYLELALVLEILIKKRENIFFYFLDFLKKLTIFTAILAIFQFLFQIDLSKFYIQFHWILPNISSIDAFHLQEAPNIFANILGIEMLRYTVFFPKPNAIASILTLSFSILLVNKRLSRIEILFLYLTILLSFVRIAQIAVTISLLLDYRTSRFKKVLMFVVVITLTLIFVFLRTKTLSIYDLNSDAIRLLFWTKAASTILSNPFGIGIGNTPEFIEKEFPSYLSHYSHIHNTFLQFILEVGIIGTLVIILFFMFLWLILSVSSKKNKSSYIKERIFDKRVLIPTILLIMFYSVDLYFFGIDYLTILYISYITLFLSLAKKHVYKGKL